MISNKFVHIKHLETFLTRKLSADAGNTTYTVGMGNEVFEGEPDISYQSIVFIKDSKFIFTHGKLYDASGESTNLKTPVKINGTDFDGSEDIITDSWGASREISITDGTNTSGATQVDGSGDISLSLPSLIDIKVTKDSEGRVIIETYPTKKDLQDAIDELDTFFVYSGDDDSDPTLTSEPASSWVTSEEKKIHAGDFYVTSEGRVFRFEEEEEGEWIWKEITDYYLYNCLSELKEVKKKVDISGEWDKEIQESVESGEIYVLGAKKTNYSYLDVLCCPGYVNYKLTSSINIHLPFVYGGSWTRTRTRYSRVSSLVKASDLSRVSGKTYTITNLSDSENINLILGNSPSGNSQSVTLSPGRVCILKFKSDIVSDNLVFYWEVVGEGGIGVTTDWE